MLPTLGTLSIPPDERGAIRLTAKDGELRAGAEILKLAQPTEHWTPLRRLRASVAGLGLDVALQDGPAGSGSFIDDWQQQLAATWHLLVTAHNPYAKLIAAGLTTLVPIADTHPWGISATSRDTFGAMSMTAPTDPLAMADTLLHEFQHTKLGALLDLVDLYDCTDSRLFYSPWRDDPRPLGGIFQGAYAYLGVSDFWHTQAVNGPTNQARRASFQLTRALAQLRLALDLLTRSGSLTDLGQRFVGIMSRVVDARQADHAGGDATALSTVDDHFVVWKLTNLHSDPERVNRLAHAWLSRATRPGSPEDSVRTAGPEPSVAPDVQPGPPALARRRFDQLGDPSAPVSAGVAMSPGELAYARRDYARAFAHFSQDVANDQDDVHAWSGLALSGRRLESGPPARLWTQRPELIRAVYNRLCALTTAAPSPSQLAEWIGRSMR
jgi:hypothetical protein